MKINSALNLIKIKSIFCTSSSLPLNFEGLGFLTSPPVIIKYQKNHISRCKLCNKKRLCHDSRPSLK